MNMINGITVPLFQFRSVIQAAGRRRLEQLFKCLVTSACT